MKILPLVAAGTAMLLAGCDDSRNAPAPTAPSLSAHGTSRSRVIQASGTFDAVVDFSTLTLTPTSDGRNCLLQVNGQLVFTGTIEGTATGQTTALVFAPCADVASNPPGTFPDVFKSELVFEGTVAGDPARANMIYTGRAQPGGQIEAYLLLYNGVLGTLDVDAVLAVGGTYRGPVVVRR
jgi:hypothetical protein